MKVKAIEASSMRELFAAAMEKSFGLWVLLKYAVLI